MENRLSFLSPGSMDFSGIYRDYLDFTFEKQLLLPQTWVDFVRVFRSDCDDADKGWRCEYWGKMMRGACLCYRATGSDELYGILRETVADLLGTQREDGRFSTYSKEAQLHGWDLWGRKYVMTGLMHFMEICFDEALNDCILTALKKHADAIIETVGNKPGQANITETSDFWGGVNSCSILEPFMALYGLCGEKRYLDFAEYILSTGGCKDGNLVEIAAEGKIPPYRYPEVKAYETISFFEGVLAYYQATGKEEYLKAVMNFFDAVAGTDLTIIGCCGCTHELFDNSSERQTEYSEKVMQETCVSVTWMRICARLLLFTGDSRFYDYIERTGYNALYGAANINSLPMFSSEKKALVGALPFDSYSPLVNNRRGAGIGGFKEFSFGGFYGCCACIASAGIALMPLAAVMKSENGICVNTMFSGRVSFGTGDNRVTLVSESTYPREGHMILAICPEKGPAEFELKIHAPADMKDTQIFLNGEELCAEEDSLGYMVVNRTFARGDSLEIKGNIPLIKETVGDSIAFRYGALVLARDEEKEPDYESTAPFTGNNIEYRMTEPREGETVRMEVTADDGRPVLLTDYASCGRHWDRNRNRVTVWMRKE